MPERPLAPGAFGENFTTLGLPEESVHIGDRFRIGSAELVVTQPRLPCFKLGIRFQSDAMVSRFLASGRMGFYFAVIREGDVESGDRIEPTFLDPASVQVSEIAHLYIAKHYSEADVQSAQRALQVEALPQGWKDHLAARLEAKSE